MNDLRSTRTPSARRRNRLKLRAVSVERLEDRWLLAVTVPDQVDPTLAEQAQFAPPHSERSLTNSLAQQLLRFSIPGDQPDLSASFETTSLQFSDGAIALYDADGNQIAKADRDDDPSSFANERLDVSLVPEQEYILAILSDTSQPTSLVLSSKLGEQVAESVIQVNPMDGTAAFETTAIGQVLESPADVNFHALEFPNGGTTANVTLTPTGADSQLFVSLFERSSEHAPWQFVSKAQAPAGDNQVPVTISSPSDSHLADNQYLLSVSPEGLASPGGAYKIAVTSDTLVPTQVDPGLAGAPQLLSLADLGEVRSEWQFAITPNSATTQSFRASHSGLAMINVSSLTVAPIVSVYDGTGSTLLAVASRRMPVTPADPLTLEFPMLAGMDYIVRVASANATAGSVDVAVAANFDAMPVDATQGSASLSNVTLPGDFGAAFFGVEALEEDMLVVEVTPQDPNSPNALVPTLSIASENALWTNVSSLESDSTHRFVIDISAATPAPLHVMLAGISGSDPVDVNIGVVEVPTELNLGTFIGGELNLSGDLAQVVTPMAFGQVQGTAFYNLVSEATGNSTIQAQSGTPTALALFEEYGGQFHRVAWTISDGTGAATLVQALTADRHHGVAVIPLATTPAPSVAIDVFGPDQTGIGVGMVPSDAPAFPSMVADNYGVDPETNDYEDPTSDATTWSAELNILDVVLENPYEQHLWRTLLPFNLIEAAGTQLEFQLEPANQLGVTVDVMQASSGVILTTLTSINGVSETQLLPVESVIPGDKLLFRVRSLPDQLDDGIYSLRLQVATENPHPYEVNERHWRFVGDTLYAVDDPYSDFTQGTPPADDCSGGNVVHCAPAATVPVGNAQEVVLSRWGYGTVEGEFGNVGLGEVNTIDVYRLPTPQSGRLRVWTETIDETVNTNLRVYRRLSVPLQSTTFDGLAPLRIEDLENSSQELVEVLPNFDWFPANRDEIDAQTYLQQIDDFGDVGPWLYVVVKNQEGSEGRYRLHVDAADAVTLQDVVAIPSTGTGLVSAPVTLTNLAEESEAIRYVPIQLPDYHDGTLRIANRAGTGDWLIDAHDAHGRSLQRASRDSNEFLVADGPHTVFVRFQETNVSRRLDQVTFDASLDLSPPAGVTWPHGLPVGPTTPVNVNAFGDGTWTASISGSRDLKKFQFTASTGWLRVRVEPSGSDRVRFGVYVDGELRSWDETQLVTGRPSEDSLWTEIHLGSGFPLFETLERASDTPTDEVLRRRDDQALATRDVAFDGAIGTASQGYHEITLYVTSVSGSTEVDVTVESTATKAMRNFELTIDPLDGSQSELTPAGEVRTDNLLVDPEIVPPVVTGNQWSRLRVPNSATNVMLGVSKDNVLAGAIPFRYSVFDPAGQPLASGELTIPAIGSPTVMIPLPPAITGGQVYDIRVATLIAGDTPLRLRASASFPNFNAPPTDIRSLPDAFPNAITLNPLGDGAITTPQSHFSFWVGAEGVVHIDATSNQPFDDVELYRIHRYPANETTILQHLALIDYQNKNGSTNQTSRSLMAHLDPGAYAIRIVGPSGQPVTVQVNTPTPPADEIVLDPNFGISDLPGLVWRDRGPTRYGRIPTNTGIGAGDVMNIIPEFRQHFFRIVTPAGTRGQGRSDAEATATGTTLLLNRDNIAYFGWWRQGDNDSFQYSIDSNQFFLNPVLNQNDELVNHRAKVEAGSGVAAHETIYVSLNRLNLNAPIEITATFPVPFSGTPDLVVLPVQLSPNNGETRVGINVTNVGYAPAFENTSHYRVRNVSLLPSFQWVTAALKTSTLGPFGSSLRALDWDPVTTMDEVEFIVDVNDDVEELDEANNAASEVMSTVNLFHPEVLSFELTNPSLDGMNGPTSDPNNEIWGRYIEGIAGIETKMEFEVRDLDDLVDGKDDIYQSYILRPTGYKHIYGSNPVYQQTFDPRFLAPTTGTNPNEFTVYTKDVWGLESERVVRKVHVVPRPKWLTSLTDGISTSISFNSSTNQYAVYFENRLVDYEKTLNQILGVDVPFVGSKKNQFLVSIGTETEVSLDPTQAVFVPVEGKALMKVLGKTVFDVTYDGSTNPTDHVALEANLGIDPETVEATAFFAALRLNDIQLLDYSSPEIKLFSYGVPGLASLNANLLIDVAASLDAGVSMAFEPDWLADPTEITPLGVSRPTYVGVTLTPGLTIEGEAEVFGFLDIASISGSIGLNLEVNLGLDNDGATPLDVVRFDDFFSELDVEINAGLSIGASASVLGFEVWSYEWDSPPLFSVGDVYTWDEYDQFTGAGSPAPAIPDPSVMAEDPDGNPIPVPAPPAVTPAANGSDSLGSLQFRAQPKLVLDGQDGLYLQTVDVGGGRANLAYARRTADVWDQNLTTLTQAHHVMNPQAAILDTGRAKTGVVTYQATNVPNLLDPSLTFDETLRAQEIRYRFFDGTNWQPEQTLESNGAYDGTPAMSFNSLGEGVLAWVHNASTNPLRNPLDNDIHVSLWDARTSTWSPPTPLTMDGAASRAMDSRPAVFMGKDGVATVVWLRQPDSNQPSAAGEQIWYRQFRNGTWTPAEPLSMPSLGTGRITQLAIGSSGVDRNGQERLDLVFAATEHVDVDQDPNTDDVVAETRLLHRSAWSDAFATSTSLQTIARDANFSYLEVLPNPDGGLTAGWQTSGNQSTDVFAATLSGPASDRVAWTQPTRLTRDGVLEVAPTFAFDRDGRGDTEARLQVIYDQRLPVGQTGAVPEPGSESSDGIPMMGRVNGQRLALLPELTFSRPLTFVAQDAAVAGGSAVAEATLRNAGFASTDLQLDLVRTSDGSVLATRLLTLGPGNEWPLRIAVPVIAGMQTIEARLTSLEADPTEMVGPEDNVSSATLFGAVDVLVESMEFNGPVTPGAQTTVDIVVHNPSALAINSAFSVSLFEGTPAVARPIADAVASQVVNSLAAGQSVTVSLPWNVPVDGELIQLTGMVDSKHELPEATEFNNLARLSTVLAPDISVGFVHAELLDYSGVNNVEVAAELWNLGNVTAREILVQLWWSRDDGTFSLLAETEVAALGAGAETTVIFDSAHAWAGHNLYRISVIPESVPNDTQRLNDVEQTSLVLQGFADLVITEVRPDAETLKEGDPLRLSVVVENQGINDAREILIEVFAVSPDFGRRRVGHATIPALGPFQQQTSDIQIDTTGLVGEIEFLVVVDRHEKVLEVSDFNNEQSVLVTFEPLNPKAPCDLNGDGVCDANDIDELFGLIASGEYHADFDVDQNGILDDRDRDDWISELMNTTPGDTNLDRVFNSTDLVLVFQAGLYEDGIPGNATFATGDWNGDGDFTSGDLVYAFQGGGYVQAALGDQMLALLDRDDRELRRRRAWQP